jgi:DNA repair protein RecN (Recombination protein N)
VHDKAVLERLENLTDVPVSADAGELLITRRLHASGRTSVSLTGHPITLSMLREVAESLVDVHGQHDHQYLLRPSNQLIVLDEFAGLIDLRSHYYQTYLALQDAKRRIEELTANRTLREQQLELYRFQADEIDHAQLDPAEFEELRSRATVLTHLEKLRKDATAVHGALYETDGSILERLRVMASVLSELCELDQNIKPVAGAVRDATLQLEDAAFDLGRYRDKLDLDPAELAEVNDRLTLINRLLNKYADTVPLVLEYRAEIGAKITELERATEDSQSLNAQISSLTCQLKDLGAHLSAKRQAAAAKLSPMIQKQLAELGMEKARFTISVDRSEESPSGFDAVEFIVQTNPGLPAQPLRKIASGGELSRIMLALKGVLAQSDRVSVLVFDEIDANVGGRLGSVIGQKLRKLADHHQVLCITHLPQIASYADRHLTVRKQTQDSQTRTTVRAIDGDDRLLELAEMIGGQRITETTKAQARELLDAAQSQPITAAVAKPRQRRAVRA